MLIVGNMSCQKGEVVVVVIVMLDMLVIGTSDR